MRFHNNQGLALKNNPEYSTENKHFLHRNFIRNTKNKKLMIMKMYNIICNYKYVYKYEKNFRQDIKIITII